MALFGISKNFLQPFFGLNKRHHGLVSVIKQNGCMLPLSLFARIKNSTLFLCQTRWLLFSSFCLRPCILLCVNFKSLLRSGKPSYQSCPTDHSSFMSCGMVLECWLGNFVGQHRKYNIFDIYTLTMLHIS